MKKWLIFLIATILIVAPLAGVTAYKADADVQMKQARISDLRHHAKKLLSLPHENSILIKMHPGYQQDTSLRQYFASQYGAVNATRIFDPETSSAHPKAIEAWVRNGLDRWIRLNFRNNEQFSSVIERAISEHNQVIECIEPESTAHIEFSTVKKPPDQAGEPDNISAAIDGDPLASQQWHLENTGQSGGKIGNDIGAKKLWTSMERSPRVPVPVLVGTVDSGVDYNHEDLQALIDSRRGIDATDPDNATNDPVDYAKHGTHVAGIIGATHNNGLGGSGVIGPLAGSSVRLLAGKFIRITTGSFAAAVKAIMYLDDQAMQDNVHLVINHSWSGPNSRLVYDALAASRDLGHLSVCSAGNNSVDSSESRDYPAAYAFDPEFRLSNVIAIASHDRFGRLSSFSNYGKGVLLSAPGGDILSTVPNNAYAKFSGTSMAAPMTSGAAAVLWSYYPEKNYFQIIQDIALHTRGLPALEKTIRGGQTLACGFLLKERRHTIKSIKNLASNAASATNVSLSVSWTVPKPPGSSIIAEYDVRYSPFPWKDSSMYKAKSVDFPPVPDISRKQEIFVISDLRDDAEYYVGVRWRDQFGNWSSFADIQRFRTRKADPIYSHMRGDSIDGWYTLGFTGYQPQSLWTNSPPACDADSDWYYGDPATCTYDTNARNAAELYSPPIDISAFSHPVVEITYRLDIRDRAFTYDEGVVQIFTVDDTGYIQYYSLFFAKQTFGSYVVSSHIVNMIPSNIKKIGLRFRFDTFDDSQGAPFGWSIRSIQIKGLKK